MVNKRTINLTFHGVGEPARELEPGEAKVWVSGDTFLEVLDAVAGRDDVRITFDDGNASDYLHALPALEERGLTGTFFVVGDRVGTPNFLTADQIRELADAGMRIGSHGMGHRRWRGLSENALLAEIQDAKMTLETIVERPVTEVACPFGSYDRRVLRTLRGLAYTRVYTSDRGRARPDAFLQARNSVGPSDGPDLLARIESLDRPPHKAFTRRAKLAVKRWR
jgi:peptidoglycan/xylan/chitin deacetylase (PgdA/CDA1 family)